MSFILRWYQCRCWFTQGSIQGEISLTTQSEFPNEVQSLEDLGKNCEKWFNEFKDKYVEKLRKDKRFKLLTN
jgi:hypothetical protein